MGVRAVGLESVDPSPAPALHKPKVWPADLAYIPAKFVPDGVSPSGLNKLVLMTAKPDPKMPHDQSFDRLNLPNLELETRKTVSHTACSLPLVV